MRESFIVDACQYPKFTSEKQAIWGKSYCPTTSIIWSNWCYPMSETSTKNRVIVNISFFERFSFRSTKKGRYVYTVIPQSCLLLLLIRFPLNKHLNNVTVWPNLRYEKTCSHEKVFLECLWSYICTQLNFDHEISKLR